MSLSFQNFDYWLALSGTFSLFFHSFFTWIEFIFRSKIFNKFTNFSFLLSSFFLFVSLAYRWYNAGYFPLSNLYESLLFLSWSLLNAYFFIEKKAKTSLVGFLVSPIALMISGFATLVLPTEMQKALPLVPALQSNWLMMHVSMMMLSYATLLVGSILCIFYTLLSGPFSSEAFRKNSSQKRKEEKQDLLKNIDFWSYRIIGIGFPFLTLGIIAGAVWANDAWGAYWSWDPKETWALITWFIFAIYLHARIIRGWEGQKAAILGSLGFLVVWICYLGVNFLGKGLHSYGWMISK
jgi:cytochrome c-type biogenesis protein CcsB